MNLFKKFNRQQKGQILIIVLIILGLGSLTAVPLLNFMGTGLSSVRTYQRNIDQLYAADAGIQKGIWYGMTNLESMKYTAYADSLEPFTINGNSVVVNLGYTWVLDGIVQPSFGPHNEIVVNTGGTGDENGVYTLQMDFTGFPNKNVKYIGVWLPNGFDYVPGSCADFENQIAADRLQSGELQPYEPQIVYTCGGTSLLWGPLPPNMSYSTYLAEGRTTQRFRFEPLDLVPSGDIAWLLSHDNSIGFSWDNNIWNYNLTSTATSIATGKSTTVTARIAIDTRDSIGTTILRYEVD